MHPNGRTLHVHPNLTRRPCDRDDRRVRCPCGRRGDVDILRNGGRIGQLLSVASLPHLLRAGWMDHRKSEVTCENCPNLTANQHKDREMRDLPRGTVTFLFTDIEGSTALWERDRQAMAAAVARHLALLDAAIDALGGVHFKTVGDGLQAAFPTAPQAVTAAVVGQRALLAEDWGEIGPLRVRMALHAGEAVAGCRGDYLAAPLNRLARLLDAAHGGQVLLSDAVAGLVRDALPDGVTLKALGEYRLRDILQPEEIFQLHHPELPATFPPLTTPGHVPHNLPIHPTPFLGREREVEEISNLLLRPDVRLVTLTGPGGVGKTRLGLRVAGEALEAFPDGAFLVDLARQTDS